MKNLLIRIFSAVIALVVLGLTIKFGSTSMFLLCFACSILGFVEFSGFLPMPTNVTLNEYKAIKIGFVVMGSFLFFFSAKYPWKLIITFPVVFVFLAAMVSWFNARKENLSDLLILLNMLFLGFIYCGILPAVSVQLISIGVGVFLCHLSAVFAGDVFAYFGGRLLGRKKLHEALSPRKTIEGSLSGLCGSILAGFLTASIAGLHLNFKSGLLLFILTGIFAQLGDLFESFLKRFAHVKDSGFIMPGHGGVLDRLDGVFFSAPVFLLVFDLLIKT